MTSVEKARDLAQRIPELKRLKGEQHRLARYKTRENLLHDANESLQEYAVSAIALHKNGEELKGCRKAVMGQLAEVRRISAAFKVDPASIDSKEIISTFWEPLRATPKKVEKEILQTWKGYVENRIPVIQAKILNILEKVPGFQQQVRKVNKKLVDMRSLGDKLPREEDFAAVDELALEITKAWQELEGDALPKPVLEFLHKAHSVGVDLASIDREVFDWLKENNLKGNYMVKARLS